jgi:hypothetical protein
MKLLQNDKSVNAVIVGGAASKRKPVSPHELFFWHDRVLPYGRLMGSNNA